MLSLARRVLAALIAFGCTTSHAGVLALDHTGGTVNFNTGTYGPRDVSAGWSFSVSSAVIVDGLGFFDRGSDGLAIDHEVGIWTGDGTSLLSQATVTNSSTPVDSTSSHGRWLFEDIDPLMLTPGDYVIAAAFSGTIGELHVFFATPTTVSEISYGTTRAGLGTGLVFPVGSSSTFDAAIFGPTFSVVQLPEPGSLALIGLGLAGLAFSRRRRTVYS